MAPIGEPQDRTHEEPDPLVGRLLSDRYRIEEFLGEGGMGRVYRAEHTLMRKRLAIKVLRAELGSIGEVVERFQREAMAAANIEHPNVVAATDFGKTEDGSLYLVMEFVEGEPLSVALTKGCFGVSRAVHVAEQMLRALSRAHSLGIIHRDLKPDNIHLVERDGDADFVKVLDFGIAKVSIGELGGPKGVPLTQVGLVYGTPEYMAPEQALGQPVDVRADLYAVGVMLYEMLAGRLPFEAEDKVHLLGMHIGVEPEPISRVSPEAGVPAALDSFVLSLLSKKRDDRPPDAAAALTLLQQAVTGIVIEASSETVRGDAPISVSVAAERTPPPSTGARLSATFVRAATEVVPVVRTGFRTAGSGIEKLVGRMRSAYERNPRRGRIVAVGAAGTSILVVALVAAIGDGEVEPPSIPPRPGVPVVVTPQLEAQVEREIQEFRESPEVKLALAKLAQGQAEAAIADLEALREREPGNARIPYLLGTIYADQGRLRTALERYEAALQIDERLRADGTLREDVVGALANRAASRAAIQLLATKIGDTAVPDLLRLAVEGSSRIARQNARTALDRMGAMEHLEPWAQKVLALGAAARCRDKRTIIVEIGNLGDERALPALERLPSTGKSRGCGFLNLEPCPPPCYAEELRAAVRKLRR